MKGEVAASSTLAPNGPIRVEFIDILSDDEREVVHSVELDEPGAFAERVSVEGERVIVRAIADADADGACSAGEDWGEIEAAVSAEDTIGPLTLTLGKSPCPAPEP